MEIIAMIYGVFIISVFLLPKRMLNILFFIFSLIMATISFFIVTNYEMDLYRHYFDIETFRNLGWDAVTKDVLMDQSLVVKNVYMYLISLTDYNGLLPSITIFLDYYLNLRIIYDCGIRYKVPSVYIAIGAILFISSFNYWMAVSGIRNWLVFAIFNYFLYKELIEGKYKTVAWAVYIFLCLFHPSTLILLILRALLLISNRFLMNAIRLLIVSWSFIMGFILQLLVQFSNNPLLTLLYVKINYYAINDDSYHLLAVVYYLCCTVIIVLLCMFCSQMGTRKRINIDKYTSFFITMALFIVGSIAIYDVERRFAQYIAIFGSVFFMLSYANFNDKIKNIKNQINRNNLIIKKKIMDSVLLLFILFNFYYLFTTQFVEIAFNF